jgi:ABC-type amino acid transport substrate-binding protein
MGGTVPSSGHFGQLAVATDDSPRPPMCFGPPGTPDFRGFEVDLLAALAGRLGSEFRYESVDWGAALQRLQVGTLNMLCRGVTITPGRRRVVGFSQPYFETTFVLVIRCDSRIQDASDLIGLKVGVRRATTAEQFLRRRYPAAAPITFDGHAEAYRALAEGAVSAVVDHHPIATHFTRSTESLRVAVDLDSAVLRYGIVFARDNERLRRAVNAALSGLESDGTLEQYRRRWLS